MANEKQYHHSWKEKIFYREQSSTDAGDDQNKLREGRFIWMLRTRKKFCRKGTFQGWTKATQWWLLKQFKDFKEVFVRDGPAFSPFQTQSMFWVFLSSIKCFCKTVPVYDLFWVRIYFVCQFPSITTLQFTQPIPATHGAIQRKSHCNWNSLSEHTHIHQRIYDTSLGSRDIAMWRFLWQRERAAEQELGILVVGW